MSKATKYDTVKSYSNVYKWSFCAAAARRSKSQDKKYKASHSHMLVKHTASFISAGSGVAIRVSMMMM